MKWDIILIFLAFDIGQGILSKSSKNWSVIFKSSSSSSSLMGEVLPFSNSLSMYKLFVFDDNAFL